MDPLSSLALTVVFAAVGFYTLYCVVRAAVAGGIRDAREKEQRSADAREAAAPSEHPPAH
ncbi:hypothetical protein [Labedella endophytica]|uniref:Uncharacterized protein n=1 Tax=Labedella endophytica TaxID=1523160 RepID=A0A433JP95_9MICO|nr:hypothetical protein [Labedella endophytica]RUQ98263.1 hypothetical protein ELQ94_14760 [Labedella endophytica]